MIPSRILLGWAMWLGVPSGSAAPPDVDRPSWAHRGITNLDATNRFIEGGTPQSDPAELSFRALDHPGATTASSSNLPALHRLTEIKISRPELGELEIEERLARQKIFEVLREAGRLSRSPGTSQQAIDLLTETLVNTTDEALRHGIHKLLGITLFRSVQYADAAI